MAFAYSRDINASSSTFYDVHLNQTNITNCIADPILEWLRKECAPEALYNAAYSPPPCSPGTREGIIGLISDWISDPNGGGLCWLSGPVGTGKSAIAQTISQRCANQGCLAATFFCSRRDADRSNGRKVISTIAYQLTGSFPSLKDPIRTAVENKLLLFEKAIPTLFQNLIVDPLIRFRSTLPRMVVVIDALDECNEQSAKDISWLIADAVKTYDLPLRFLVTSRPTSHIEVHFIRSHSVTRSLTLGDFDVHDDIRLFLSHRFKEIYEAHYPVMREVAKPWPSDDVMDQLMRLSHNLFIFAASITRFVDNHNCSPDDLLKMILSSEQSSLSAYAELDQLYKQTLSQCVDTKSLRLILGTIICLRNPLPLPAIAVLLQSQITIGHLRAILQLLRPVLLVPVDEREPIATFHQSFHDFITDKTRSGNEFYIDPEEYAVGLADSCLDLLTSSESLELSKDMNQIALDYARTHYLSLLRGRKVNDGWVLEFIQLFACNAVALVAGTLLSNFLHNRLESITSPIGCRVVVYATMIFTFISLYSVMFLITDDGDHLYSGMVPAFVSGFEGGGRCLDPVICGSDMDPIVRAFTGGAAFDTVLRTISGLDAGVTCTVPPTEDISRSAIRTIISGGSFDLVVFTIIWIYVSVVNQRARPPQSTVTAVRIAGIMVGRGAGAALIASTDITGAFWNIINVGLVSSTILFNFQDIHWLLASFRYEINCLLKFICNVASGRPIEDSQKHYYIWMSQYPCRWIKARYYYTLNRHKIRFSFTAPLQFVIHLVEFYVATLKPTHVLATTFTEHLFCDWCRWT